VDSEAEAAVLAAEARDQAGRRNPASLSPAVADLCRVPASRCQTDIPVIMQSAKSKPKRCNQPIKPTTVNSTHVYEVRPRRDKRGVDLISDALPFGRLWYGEPNAIGYVEVLQPVVKFPNRPCQHLRRASSILHPKRVAYGHHQNIVVPRRPVQWSQILRRQRSRHKCRDRLRISLNQVARRDTRHLALV
jgi:hypothetical protein